jgi:hypothetical protein
MHFLFVKGSEMTSKGQLLLNELFCLYDLAIKKETCIERAPLVCNFANALLREPFWQGELSKEKEVFDIEFESFYTKRKTIFNKICDVRKKILKYLADHNLEYILKKIGAGHWLKTKSVESETALLILQYLAAQKVLDFLQDRHSEFVEQFIIPESRRNKNEDKYKFIAKYDAFMEELNHFNRMSSTFIWHQVTKLKYFCILYDPKNCDEFEEKNKKNNLALLSFSVCKQHLNKSIGLEDSLKTGETGTNLTLELEAMQRICHFLAKSIGGTDDKKKMRWNYTLGRFIGNGEVVTFQKKALPAMILEILTESPASMEKIWCYEELRKLIAEKLSTDYKDNYFHKVCKRINATLEDATGIIKFLICDSTTCHINPDYID